MPALWSTLTGLRISVFRPGGSGGFTGTVLGALLTAYCSGAFTTTAWRRFGVLWPAFVRPHGPIRLV